MKNNENLSSSEISDHLMNESSSDEQEMTAEEYRLYREILDAAYPKPKRDIKSGVMAAILAESGSGGVILSPAKKKNKWQTAAVKWGSLAASIAIVAMVVIKVLPSYISKDSVAYDSVNQEAKSFTASHNTDAEAEYDASPSETAAGESTVLGLYKSVYTYSTQSDNGAAIAEEGVSDEYEVYTDSVMSITEAAEEECIEAPAVYSIDADAAPECETVIETEAAAKVEDCTTDAAAPEAVIRYSATADYGNASKNAASNSVVIPMISCSHTEVFRDSYHEIPQSLINAVGESEYYAWANEVSRDDQCAVNIANFLEDFGISEASFAAYLTYSDIAYYCDYPLDLLYSGDSAAIEEYYENGGNYAEMVKNYFEYEVKLALISETGTTAYTQWLENTGHTSVRSWPISRMVQDNGIDEAKFTEIYNATAEDFAEEYSGYALPEYDTEKLYSEDTPSDADCRK